MQFLTLTLPESSGKVQRILRRGPQECTNSRRRCFHRRSQGIEHEASGDRDLDCNELSVKLYSWSELPSPHSADAASVPRAGTPARRAGRLLRGSEMVGGVSRRRVAKPHQEVTRTKLRSAGRSGSRRNGP